MKVCFIYAGSDVGFLVLRDEKSMEAWLFYDQEEGKAALYKCDDDEEQTANVVTCRDSIERSGLPEESDDDPFCIRGMVCETMVRLIAPICQGRHSEPMAVLKSPSAPPALYFLFAPHRQDRQDPASLLGLRYDAGKHSVFVMYSKAQGRAILRAHSARMDPEKLQLFQASLENHNLPEISDTQVIRIGDPLACYMNMGYTVMLAQASVR